MKSTATKSAPVGYVDLARGKIVAYGSAEHREIQKARKSAVRKSTVKTPRKPTPLAELKAFARKIGKTELEGTYLKVNTNGIILIVDTEELYFAEENLRSYAKNGDLDGFVEVADGVYLDEHFEDDAADILPLFGIEMDTE